MRRTEIRRFIPLLSFFLSFLPRPKVGDVAVVIRDLRGEGIPGAAADCLTGNGKLAALASPAHSSHYSFSCGHPAAAPGSSEEEGKRRGEGREGDRGGSRVGRWGRRLARWPLVPIPDPIERRVRDAAADFTRASGEKKPEEGGDFLLFTRSRQILRPLHILFQTVTPGYVLAEVIHEFDDLLPKY